MLGDLETPNNKGEAAKLTTRCDSHEISNSVSPASCPFGLTAAGSPRHESCSKLRLLLAETMGPVRPATGVDRDADSHGRWIDA
jgi:hypothetical protein